MLIKNFYSLDQLNYKKGSDFNYEPFANETIQVFERISKKILRNKKFLNKQDIYTFGFWCRKSNIVKMKSEFLLNSTIKKGFGLVFHVPPSNIPTLALYSLFIGCISGNQNIIRISPSWYDYLEEVINIITKEFSSSPQLNKKNYFILYEKNTSHSKTISKIADSRIVWGSDDTIKKFKLFETKTNCLDIFFGNKYSIAAINLSKFKKLNQKELKKIVLDFYNDTFINDQNACSSPRQIFWIGNKKDKKTNYKLFWSELSLLVKKKYLIDYGIVSRRIDILNEILLKNRNLKLNTRYSEPFFRVKFNKKNKIKNLKSFAGIFYEIDIKNLDDLIDFLDEKTQTLSHFGLQKKDIEKLLKFVNYKNSIDRVVPFGRTLDFSMIWDGKNIFEKLTKNITLK